MKPNSKKPQEVGNIPFYSLPEVAIYPNNRWGDIARKFGLQTARNWSAVRQGTTKGINDFWSDPRTQFVMAVVPSPSMVEGAGEAASMIKQATSPYVSKAVSLVVKPVGKVADKIATTVAPKLPQVAKNKIVESYANKLAKQFDGSMLSNVTETPKVLNKSDVKLAAIDGPSEEWYYQELINERAAEKERQAIINKMVDNHPDLSFDITPEIETKIWAGSKHNPVYIQGTMKKSEDFNNMWKAMVRRWIDNKELMKTPKESLNAFHKSIEASDYIYLRKDPNFKYKGVHYSGSNDSYLDAIYDKDLASTQIHESLGHGTDDYLDNILSNKVAPNSLLHEHYNLVTHPEILDKDVPKFVTTNSDKLYEGRSTNLELINKLYHKMSEETGVPTAKITPEEFNNYIDKRYNLSNITTALNNMSQDMTSLQTGYSQDYASILDYFNDRIKNFSFSDWKNGTKYGTAWKNAVKYGLGVVPAATATKLVPKNNENKDTK